MDQHTRKEKSNHLVLETRLVMVTTDLETRNVPESHGYPLGEKKMGNLGAGWLLPGKLCGRLPGYFLVGTLKVASQAGFLVPRNQ